MNAGHQLEIDPSTGEELYPAFVPKVRYNYPMNTGSLIEIDPLTGEEFFPSLSKISAPTFLLIQGREILDYNSSPVQLAFALADRQADITVALGITNEFRKKEVVGICAHYVYKCFANHWVVTVDSEIPQEIDITGKPGIVLRDYLYKLKERGRLSDPLNFSKVILRAEV
jgi:hypothetical protein